MSREQAMWQSLRPHMVAAGLDPVRIETPTANGIPDVNYTGGWIELKCIEAWPKRETSNVPLEHYTPEQRAWGLKRALACRKRDARFTGSWVLLHVKRERLWLLYPADVSYNLLGRATKAELLAAAHVAVDSPSDPRLIQAL